MLAYVQALVNIALRKLGPEDLPDSRFLLGLTLAAYLLLQVPLVWIVFGASDILAQSIIADIVMLIAFLWLLLRVAGYSSRFRQTLTALLGISALLSVLSMPFSIWHQISIDRGSGAALPSTVIFAITLWSIAIDGHILSRALSKSYGIGLMVAVVYFFLNTTVLLEIMPAGTAE